MRICAAQLSPDSGDLERNIRQHVALINAAINEKVDFICFPELSLTGYEPALAREFAVLKDDRRLDVFQQMSDESGITIAIGAPVQTDHLPTISMLIFRQNQPLTQYRKHLLHEDEIPFFSAGNSPAVLDDKDEKIAPAICYESLQPSLVQHAIEQQASVYLVSVAKIQRNIETAQTYFSDLAADRGLYVLMSNCFGHCDSFTAAGQSTAWLKNQRHSMSLTAYQTGFVGVDTRAETLFKWIK